MFVPLAERLRPRSLDEVVGQDHLIGRGGFLTQILNNKKPLSIIFWGPPGSGKTTLARLYAKAFSAHFVSFSAVFSGISELKKVVKETQSSPLFHRQTSSDSSRNQPPSPSKNYFKCPHPAHAPIKIWRGISI